MYLIPGAIFYNMDSIYYTVVNKYKMGTEDKTNQYHNLLLVQQKYQEYLKSEDITNFTKMWKKYQNNKQYKQKLQSSYDKIQELHTKSAALDFFLNIDIAANVELKDEDYNQYDFNVYSIITKKAETIMLQQDFQLKSPDAEKKTHLSDPIYFKSCISLLIGNFFLIKNAKNQKVPIEKINDILQKYNQRPRIVLDQLTNEYFELNFPDLDEQQKLQFKLWVWRQTFSENELSLNLHLTKQDQWQEINNEIKKVVPTHNNLEQNNFPSMNSFNKKLINQEQEQKEQKKEAPIFTHISQKITEINKEATTKIKEIEDEQSEILHFKIFVGMMLASVVFYLSMKYTNKNANLDR